MDLETLTDRLRRTLGAILDEDEFDLTSAKPGELDCSTDDWTLHVEGWPDGIAWLAIDDEPDDPAEFEAALRSALGEPALRALASVDAELGGALARALRASGDPLTSAAVGLIGAGRAGESSG